MLAFAFKAAAETPRVTPLPVLVSSNVGNAKKKLKCWVEDKTKFAGSRYREGFPDKPKFGLFFPLIFSKAYFEKKGKFPLKIRAYFWKNTK